MKAMIAAAFAALLSTGAAKDQCSFAVLRFNNKQLTKGRMDPIRDPGQTSAHVHSILGGSGFSKSSKGPDLERSNCSTAKVKGDNSNYWFPALYFKDPQTGKFESVELFYANAYYFFEPTNDEIKAFPLGLGIISGDPDTRAPPAGGAVTNLDPSKGPVNPIKWTCPRDGNRYDPPSWPADSDGTLAGIGDPVNKGEGVGFPDVNCDGFASPLRADIHFPSCYNPEAGLTDYKNNMAFPSEGAGGKQDCPKGWVHVPHLFLEIYWDTLAYKDRWETGKARQPFTLSNGDSTGFSLHADFMAGWDENVLQHIIDTCDAGTAGMDKCPGLPLGLNEGDCTIESLVDEKVDGVLDSIPGSNPESGWAYGGTSNSSAAPSQESGSAPSASMTDAPHRPTDTPHRPTDSQGYSAEGVKSGLWTPLSAQKQAESQQESSAYEANPESIASLESSVPASSELAKPPTYKAFSRPSPALEEDGSNPSGPPEASSYSAPGTASWPTGSAGSPDSGKRTVTVTKKMALELVTVTREMASTPTRRASYSTRSVGGFKYAGCFKDASDRALDGLIRPDLGSMSNDKCVTSCEAAGFALAGTEFGGQCYCGNELSRSQRLDDGKCDMACEGDASQPCGGDWALSVYSKDGRAALEGADQRRRHFHHHVRRHRGRHS